MNSFASISITVVIKIYADVRFFQQFKVTLHIVIAFMNLLNIPRSNKRKNMSLFTSAQISSKIMQSLVNISRPFGYIEKKSYRYVALKFRVDYKILRTTFFCRCHICIFFNKLFADLKIYFLPN